MITFETKRAKEFGIDHFVCISVIRTKVWQKYIQEHLKNNNNIQPRLALCYGGSRKDIVKSADIIIATYESALTYLMNDRLKL
jgi:hypothetical protein